MGNFTTKKAFSVQREHNKMVNIHLKALTVAYKNIYTNIIHTQRIPSDNQPLISSTILKQTVS